MPEEGRSPRYLLMKDPTKSILRLYDIPWETFEEEEEDEEDDEFVDDEVRPLGARAWDSRNFQSVLGNKVISLSPGPEFRTVPLAPRAPKIRPRAQSPQAGADGKGPGAGK